jgi:heme exporter protein D
MVNAALVCSLVAFLVLVNIEAWRRRTVARQVVDSRRTAARERAWQAVGHLDRDA